jgi:hypothetical protein
MTSNLNQDILSDIKISPHELLIIKSFEDFYKIKYHADIIYTITQSLSNISIRLIDHFITKYSKTNKICYKINEHNNEYIINIHTSYKQQLKCYQKKYFDPFSRGTRIPYFINDKCIITTIGQLNFFKWFISKKVYNFILLNKDKIEKDMNSKNKIKKIKKIKENNKITKIKFNDSSEEKYICNKSNEYNLKLYKKSYKNTIKLDTCLFQKLNENIIVYFN